MLYDKTLNNLMHNTCPLEYLCLLGGDVNLWLKRVSPFHCRIIDRQVTYVEEESLHTPSVYVSICLYISESSVLREWLSCQ